VQRPYVPKIENYDDKLTGQTKAVKPGRTARQIWYADSGPNPTSRRTDALCQMQP
jgi:hypothetical protein